VDVPVYAAIDRFVVNCEASSFALQARLYVSATGEEIPAIAHDGTGLEYRAATPGSMAATLVAYLCDRGARH